MTNTDNISRAAAALAAGGAVVFPTDTVYGLAVAVGPCDSPAKLFRIKRRDEGKPVAWLVAGPEALDTYGKEVPAWARAAATAFWPGALTLIVRTSQAVPAAFASAEGTIGLRMPASDTALQIIRGAGVPLATTSANISGRPAPASPEELDPELLAQADAVVCEGICAVGTASTVVSCLGEEPQVLREGSVSAAQIWDIYNQTRENKEE